jgi:hypothetical protein
MSIYHIYPYFSLTCLIAMTSLIKQRSPCSSCARPWHSTQFKTCDNCRRKARTAYRSRKRAGTMSGTNLLTKPSVSKTKNKSKSFPLSTPLPNPLPTLLPRPQFNYCQHSPNPPPSIDSRKRSLPQLAPAPPRDGNLPVFENPRIHERTAHDQARLYPNPNKHECHTEQALNFLR